MYKIINGFVDIAPTEGTLTADSREDNPTSSSCLTPGRTHTCTHSTPQPSCGIRSPTVSLASTLTDFKAAGEVWVKTPHRQTHFRNSDFFSSNTWKFMNVKDLNFT